MTGKQQQRLIVIVDDHVDVRRVLRGAVESMGSEYKVVDTPSAEEAWLVLSNQPVELLVLDVRLPGMSGLDFFKRLRSRKPDIKVILITGVSDPELRKQAETARANAFFLKPVNLAEFQQKVEKLLCPAGKKAESKPVLQPLTSVAKEKTLPDILERLRLQTSAGGAVLLGKELKVLARAGIQPAWLAEAGWMHSLVLSYRIGVQKLFGEKIKPWESGLSLKGPGLEIAFFPINSEFILLLWSEQGHPMGTGDAEDIKKAAAEILERLANARRSQPQPSSPQKADSFREEAPPQADQVLVTPSHPLDMDKLFIKGEKKKLNTKELNNFWEEIASEEAGYERDTGRISFEEARRMGLTPGGEEESSP
jgi:CheY-like chemotaxis protein